MPNLALRLKNEFNDFTLIHESDYFQPFLEIFREATEIKVKRVLDFGCGSGDLVILLQKMKQSL